MKPQGSGSDDIPQSSAAAEEVGEDESESDGRLVVVLLHYIIIICIKIRGLSPYEVRRLKRIEENRKVFHQIIGDVSKVVQFCAW
jgi:hypothetical protein